MAVDACAGKDYGKLDGAYLDGGEAISFMKALMRAQGIPDEISDKLGVCSITLEAKIHNTVKLHITMHAKKELCDKLVNNTLV